LSTRNTVISRQSIHIFIDGVSGHPDAADHLLACPAVQSSESSRMTVSVGTPSQAIETTSPDTVDGCEFAHILRLGISGKRE
jgi:hypothetical protein